MTEPARAPRAGRLAGKVALVTGGANGLGAAIGAAFAREGASVVLSDVDTRAGQETAERLGALFLPHDVGDEAAWAGTMARIVAHHGRLDVLVNNAGCAPVERGLTPEDVDLEQTRRIFRVNFEGALLGCKHAIGAMKVHGGSIVNMSSVAALQPVPFITAYGAAKAAVLHLTRSVALHCARAGYRIRCNAVHPGQIRTSMHTELLLATAATQGIGFDEAEEGFRRLIPSGEYGRPEDVAAAVLFLAGDESAHVTGDRIVVDGGMTLVG